MPIRSMSELWNEKQEVESVEWTPYQDFYILVNKEVGATYAKAYAEAVRNRLFKFGRYIITEPTKVELTFYLKSPTSAPDIDNLVKEVLDQLIGYECDNRVTTLIAKKRKGQLAIEVKVSKDEELL